MNINLIRSIIFGTIVCFPSFAFAADWQITEIMYNPKGSDAKHEWIEIKNIGSTTLNIKGFYFFESDTNHSIKLIEGSEEILSGGFVIICDDPSGFKTDFPNFSGNLFDATFSLGNEKGDAVEWRNSSKIVQDRVFYNPATGGNDSGTTLSLFNLVWKEGVKTPGDTNILNNLNTGEHGVTGSGTATNTATQTSNTTTGSNSSPRKTNFEPFYTIVVPAQDYIDAFQEYYLPVKIMYHTPDGSFQKMSGLITINFGDGNSFEGEISKIPKHFYHRGGKYAVYISYRSSRLVDGYDIESDFDLSVGDLSSVTYQKIGNLIEFSNKGNHDIDIGEHVLKINTLSKILPRRTIISRGSTIGIEVPGLGVNDQMVKIMLISKEGREIPINSKVVSKSESEKGSESIAAKKKAKKKSAKKARSSYVQSGESGALNSETNIAESKISNPLRSISHLILGLCGISGILIYSMYIYFRRKKKELMDNITKVDTHELPFTIIEKNQNGFTIFEMVIVLAIVGIFIALSSFYFVDYRNAAIDKERISQVRAMTLGLEMYRKKCGVYPTSLSQENPQCSKSIFELNNVTPFIQNLVMYNPRGSNGFCTGYHIGISLKRISNEVKLDDDFDSRGASCLPSGDGFNGNDDDGNMIWIYDVHSKNESQNQFDQ